ncbi:unnamed protein product [Ceratitis capitata]|uniref:(Mediterranean fruit fly) hypothetical protein n=1 Tax=Ceratitis capitata TaxID=7213 RepID=A0A811URX3_CERCA|nr:unnamed protein product [Ceratitis capitata]
MYATNDTELLAIEWALQNCVKKTTERACHIYFRGKVLQHYKAGYRRFQLGRPKEKFSKSGIIVYIDPAAKRNSRS